MLYVGGQIVYEEKQKGKELRLYITLYVGGQIVYEENWRGEKLVLCITLYVGGQIAYEENQKGEKTCSFVLYNIFGKQKTCSFVIYNITLYVGGQIVYEENSGFFTLYMVAQSPAERQGWVEAIRKGQSVSQCQYPLLAPSVCCSQMV